MGNFTAGANTPTLGVGGIPQSGILDEQVHAVDGAITLSSGAIHITKGSIATLTLAAPDHDGQCLKIVSDTAFAHTVTNTTPGFNNNAGTPTLTFSGTAGDSVEVESYNGAWWVLKSTGTINVSYRGAMQVLSANGAITAKNGLCIITKGSACAATLAAPTTTTDDGARLTVISASAYAHTITQAAPGFNAGTPTVVVFLPNVGATFECVAYQGAWLIVNAEGTLFGNNGAIQAITGDGAITIKNGLVVLSKGSAAAITIAAPTATTDDGGVLRIITATAQAHVVTSAVDGFNAKGASGTATFTAAIGNAFTIVAYNGHWYTVSLLNVTIA